MESNALVQFTLRNTVANGSQNVGTRTPYRQIAPTATANRFRMLRLAKAVSSVHPSRNDARSPFLSTRGKPCLQCWFWLNLQSERMV